MTFTSTNVSAQDLTKCPFSFWVKSKVIVKRPFTFSVLHLGPFNAERIFCP